MRFAPALGFALIGIACSGTPTPDPAVQEGDFTADGGRDAGGDAGNGFVDPRDGKTYPTIAIGTKTWLARNLAFESPNGSFCYDDDDRNCESDGRLYTFAAAKTVCPAGTHLPSDDEWKDLEVGLGMQADQLDLEGYSTVRGTNEGTKAKAQGGFGAIPAGYRGGGVYDARGDRTYLWTSTMRGSEVWRRRISVGEPTIFRFTNATADFAISVRCVLSDG